MAWQKTSITLKRRLNHHGLGVLVEAGLICREAERLYPDLFEAISVRNNVLHIKTTKAQQLQFVMIQGKLLKELQTYCKAQNLQEITNLRLTIGRK